MLRNKPTYIYCLICPKTFLVKYVGKTIDLKTRFRKHLSEKNKTLKCQWIKGLLSKGLNPIFKIIDEIKPNGDWESAEKNYIAYYKSIGEAFCNQTIGGESGPSQGKACTEAHKLAISKSHLGKKSPHLITLNKITKGFKVLQLTLSGELINTHNSTHDAAKSINRNQRRVQAMCKYGHINGKTINHVGGYIFKYA